MKKGSCCAFAIGGSESFKLHDATPHPVITMDARGAWQTLAARRASPSKTGCRDPVTGTPRASARCPADSETLGAGFTDWPLIVMRFWPSSAPTLSIFGEGTHYGLCDQPGGWRRHHRIGVSIANCVATLAGDTRFPIALNAAFGRRAVHRLLCSGGVQKLQRGSDHGRRVPVTETTDSQKHSGRAGHGTPLSSQG